MTVLGWEKLDRQNQKLLKSRFLEKISNGAAPQPPFGMRREEENSKTLILAFEANSALSRENETKIVKITHSVMLALLFQDVMLPQCFKNGKIVQKQSCSRL